MVIVYVLAPHGGIMRLRTASTVADAARMQYGKRERARKPLNP
jgi:hypothetical protein